MKNYILQMPGQVYGGEHSLSRILEIIAGSKKTAVFTDKGIVAAGLLGLVLEQIKAAGKDYVVFDCIMAEPTYMQVQEIVDGFRKSGADFIIAVGGGSVMDTAKLASILATDQYGVKDLLADPGLGKKYVRTLMIPTTAGTGAEATPNAIVAEPEKEIKTGIVNNEMFADYVILDAIMIKELPRRISAATGVDALCHAIECWTSNNANPFSDMYAMSALDLIFNNIEKSCDTDDMEAKKNMQTGSFFAGVAIAASGTTAVHALSYPLGGKYHIAHGVSNAVLLLPVMRFNEPVCRRKLADVYDRCVHGEKTCASAEDKSAYIIKWMEKIIRHLDIPTSLKTFGVQEKDLDGLVESGMAVTRLLSNNMRQVMPEDARKIYQEIM